LINHLYHTSRSLILGQFSVHSNFFIQLTDSFHHSEHGLSRDDIYHNDRQNWASAQSLTFSNVTNCFQKLLVGDGEGLSPNPSVTGVMVFLKVIWCYVEIFCSGKASLSERIQYASCVVHFLAFWHNFVSSHPSLSLSKNFLSRETYLNTLLSCHFAVSLICYMAEQHPQVACLLDQTGTDVVENFFSKNGQWVGNRHNYTFGRMRNNFSQMV
jgi:hypothetical protein